MGVFLGNAVYPVVKLVERASIRLGYGEFEGTYCTLLDGYKCIECHQTPSSPECLQCRTAWTREVGHINYSDAFECRANISIGAACLVMAASSWLLNNALDIWEFGPFMASLNAVLLAYTPNFGTLPTILRSIYIAALACLFTASLVAFGVGFCIAMFLFCMNPTSKRMYKHMTPSAIVSIAIISVVYMVVLLQRVYIMDGLMVVIPVFTGVLALLLVLCMRKSDEQGNGGEEGKLV